MELLLLSVNDQEHHNSAGRQKRDQRSETNEEGRHSAPGGRRPRVIRSMSELRCFQQLGYAVGPYTISITARRRC